MKALTSVQKNIVDTVLGFIGLAGGLLVNSAASLPLEYQPFAPIGGALLGLFASDATTIVNTGVLPTVATVVEQLKTNWPTAKTALQTEVSKLPAGQQGYANVGLAAIDAYVSGQTPAEIAATIQKGLTGA